MSLRVLLPPIVAGGIVAFLLLRQEASITQASEDLKASRNLLHIATSPLDGGGGDSFQATDPITHLKNTFAADFSAGRWKLLAADLLKMQSPTGANFDIQRMAAIQSFFADLSVEDFRAALISIDDADLTPEERGALRQTLIEKFAERDPLFVLENTHEELANDNSGFHWGIVNAFSKLLEEDPTAAQAWFAQVESAGLLTSRKLSGEHSGRLELYGALISHSLTNDFSSAVATINSLPDEEVVDVLQNNYRLQIDADTYQAFVDLVRTTVPEKDRFRILATPIWSSFEMDGFFTRADKLLDSVALSPAEKDGVLAQASDKYLDIAFSSNVDPTPDQFSALQTWLAENSTGDSIPILARSVSSYLRFYNDDSTARSLEIVIALDSQNPNSQFLENVYRNMSDSREGGELRENIPPEYRDRLLAVDAEREAANANPEDQLFHR